MYLVRQAIKNRGSWVAWQAHVPSHAACGLSSPLSLFGRLSAIIGIKNEDLGKMATKASKNKE